MSERGATRGEGNMGILEQKRRPHGRPPFHSKRTVRRTSALVREERDPSERFLRQRSSTTVCIPCIPKGSSGASATPHSGLLLSILKSGVDTSPPSRLYPTHRAMSSKFRLRKKDARIYNAKTSIQVRPEYNPSTTRARQTGHGRQTQHGETIPSTSREACRERAPGEMSAG